jgi:probable F420-dependent oxidoreductase
VPRSTNGLELSPTFGVVVPPYGPFVDPEELWSVVMAAEELGYASVWFGDHIVVPPYAAALTPPDWFDAVALCLVGLGRTSRLRFGTDVLVAPYRRPVEFAHLAASADRLGAGRLTLGMGVGFLEGEFEALQTPYADRGAVTDEYLQVLRLLWESEGQPVSYSGRWVSFSNVLFGPPPLQKPLPLWIGGNGDRALRRAASLGDGWHPLFCSPEQYRAGRDRIQRLLAENGREQTTFSFSYSCPPTQLIAAETAPGANQAYGGAPQLPPDYDYLPPMPVDPTGRSRFVGTPEQVAADIEDFASAGVEHFALRFSVGAPGDSAEKLIAQLEWFARDVASAVRPDLR